MSYLSFYFAIQKLPIKQMDKNACTMKHNKYNRLSLVQLESIDFNPKTRPDYDLTKKLWILELNKWRQKGLRTHNCDSYLCHVYPWGQSVRFLAGNQAVWWTLPLCWSLRSAWVGLVECEVAYVLRSIASLSSSKAWRTWNLSPQPKHQSKILLSRENAWYCRVAKF